MKIIIDIPEDYKEVVDNLVLDGKEYLLPYAVEIRITRAIKIGTPLEKVLEDIKAEIESKKYIVSAERCLEIIDKHISGKEKE